jgi:hypothetical protein
MMASGTGACAVGGGARSVKDVSPLARIVHKCTRRISPHILSEAHLEEELLGLTCARTLLCANGLVHTHAVIVVPTATK